jgi:cation-transporting ATPase F
VHEVILLLETDPVRGLTTAEADARRQRFGPNVLPPNRSHGPVVRFLLQLHNPLIYVLLGAAAVTAAIGSMIDTAVILGVVLVNAIVGYVQEWKAGKALEALAAATRTMATVVRDGVANRVDSTALVPGDLVTVEAGDKVPADLRLIRVHDLHVDESALTGESVPVEKADVLVPTDTTLGDRVNMAYSSTLVTGGAGTGIAVATGGTTEIGLIHQLVGAAEGVQTPLTRKLQVFSRWLTVVILALAAVTFAIGVVRGESPADMVVAAVALAVGAIPEGLPAAVTITLAIGVSRMARRNAIIRKLPAAETLGSTTIVCTDKTGTLTQNRMTVQYLYADGRVHDLASALDPAARACLVAGVLCNDAGLSVDDAGRVTGLGDPTEVALLLAASERGLVEHPDVLTWRRIDHLPFSSDLRLMATLHVRGEDGPGVVWVKGATEEVLARCVDARGADGTSVPIDHDAIDRQLAEFGDRALRVLAFASCEVPPGWRFEVDGLDSLALTFLGLQAMSDPPRPEAIRAIEACRTAGIRVLMITGDHARTASAIAREMGLAGDRDPVVLTGAELAAIDPVELQNRLASADVLARVSAEQKLRVVEALQHLGHVVAMTGDGVNDAPALKQADIGIAMGLGGTEVAKESADMVLTDDDFASIESAVEEGRSVFDNLTKFIAWTLPTNIGEGLVVLVAIVVGAVLPILPVQILWINMTTAVALGLMLAFEPAEPGIMRRPPRPPRQPILTRRLVVRIVLVGVLMLIGAFGCFEWAIAQGATLEEARTLAVNAFVAMEIGYLMNCRSLDRSVLSVGLFSNRPLLLGVAVMVALQVAFTYLPFMNAAFQTAPLPWSDWAAVTVLGVVVSAIIGVEKRLTRRR